MCDLECDLLVCGAVCMIYECESKRRSTCEFMLLNTLTVGSFIVHSMRHRAIQTLHFSLHNIAKSQSLVTAEAF